MTQRWKHAPAGSNWGEFGPDDQRGRMNLVDRAKVLQGVAEVREGLTFCLSLPLDVPGGMALNPRRLPPQRYATLQDPALRHSLQELGAEPVGSTAAEFQAFLDEQMERAAHILAEAGIHKE